MAIAICVKEISRLQETNGSQYRSMDALSKQRLQRLKGIALVAMLDCLLKRGMAFSKKEISCSWKSSARDATAMEVYLKAKCFAPKAMALFAWRLFQSERAMAFSYVIRTKRCSLAEIRSAAGRARGVHRQHSNPIYAQALLDHSKSSSTIFQAFPEQARVRADPGWCKVTLKSVLSRHFALLPLFLRPNVNTTSARRSEARVGSRRWQNVATAVISSGNSPR